MKYVKQHALYLHVRVVAYLIHIQQHMIHLNLCLMILINLLINGW